MSRKEEIANLIKIHNRRLQILREQLALEGRSVDPKIPIEIEDIEAAIATLQTELETLEYDDISRQSPKDLKSKQRAQVFLHSDAADKEAQGKPSRESNDRAKPVEIFFSYAHEDEALRDELAKHLSILQRQGLITAWYDRDITAGSERAGEIDEHLDSADIILLLISPDFMASDYRYDTEMVRALERHDWGDTVVIPVILRPTQWKNAPFGKLQALPKNGKPVTSWSDQDEALLNVTEGIQRVADRITAGA